MHVGKCITEVLRGQSDQSIMQGSHGEILSIPGPLNDISPSTSTLPLLQMPSSPLYRYLVFPFFFFMCFLLLCDLSLTFSTLLPLFYFLTFQCICALDSYHLEMLYQHHNLIFFKTGHSNAFLGNGKVVT